MLLCPKGDVIFNVMVGSLLWWTLVCEHEITLLCDIHLTNTMPKWYNCRRTCHCQLYKRLMSSWTMFTYFSSYLIRIFFHRILSILNKQRNKWPLVGKWWPRGDLYRFLMKTEKIMEYISTITILICNSKLIRGILSSTIFNIAFNTSNVHPTTSCKEGWW